MSDLLISQIFEANLSFSALLLAVQGILISLYLRAQHEKWKNRFRMLLLICGGTFLIAVIDCILALFFILSSPGSYFFFNLIVALFVTELVILGSASLWLVIVLVKS